MIRVLSAEQARAFDRYAIEEARVSGAVLMENAGHGAVLELRRRFGPGCRVLIACGPGNNGGDGLVMARHLLSQGHEVSVWLLDLGSRLRGDAALNLAAWLGVGGQVTEVVDDSFDIGRCLGALAAHKDVVVDALFGTGLSRPLTGRFAALVEAVNAAGLPVVALDTPSGLHADTGAVLGVAIAAAVTVTFGHAKPGLLTAGGADHAGEVCVVGLGLPSSLGPGAQPEALWLEDADVGAWLKARRRSAHKGNAGRVVVVGGSVGTTGAALLAGTGALRAGAGVVTLCALPEAAASLDHRVIEMMTKPICLDAVASSLDAALQGADVAVLGPGLGLTDVAREIVDHVVLSWRGTTVIDADGLSHFAGRAEVLRSALGPCLLTPHPGELGRLLGMSAAAVEADRFGAVRRAVALTEQTVLLKGPHTLIGAPERPIWVTSGGHCVLATAGSGDVLAGVCGALSVHHEAPRAAALATTLHGGAARAWVREHGGADRGLLAREIAERLPGALAALAATAAALPK